MKIVIPVRPGQTNEPLRYALRAWDSLDEGFEPLVIGGKPTWYTGDHISTDQRAGMGFQWTRNFPLAMRAAVEAMDEPFWWTADDIFPLKKFQPLTFCRLHDIDVYLASWANRSIVGYTKVFLQGMESQRDVLRDLGITTQDNADMHMPHLLDPDLLGSMMEMLESKYPDHPVGHFRMIYGGLHPGQKIRMRDPKIGTNQPIREDLGWVSTSDYSWRSRGGILLRRKFADRSPWETR